MRRIDYAPGPYLNFCVLCNAEFRGHLLAVRCEKCASVDTHAERCDVKQAQPARVGSAVLHSSRRPEAGFRDIQRESDDE